MVDQRSTSLCTVQSAGSQTASICMTAAKLSCSGGRLNALGFTHHWFCMQFTAGAVVFLLPNVALRRKQQLSPIHQYLGRAVFVGGLANMAVGVQEKTAFVQAGMQLSGAGLRDSVIAIPAALQVFLALTGLLVLSHHVMPVREKGTEDPALLDDASA